MGSCILLLLRGSRGSIGLISPATKIWADSDENPRGEWWSLFPLGCNVMLRQEPFSVHGGNLTKPPLNCRTELLEELQPGKKIQESFAIDFRVRIASVPLLGCKLYHFRGRKCAQSLKSHTRVNAAECSVPVRVTKITSVFLPFYYLSWRIKPPGILTHKGCLCKCWQARHVELGKLP